jgi:cystine transport system substrate-binding protein
MKRLWGILVVMFVAGSVFAGAKKEGAQAANSLERIKAAGVFIIGIEGTYPPYTYHDESNALVGYDVEVAQAISAKLGVKPQFVETHWDSLILGLDTGKWETVINQVGVTAARQEKYDFSTPYTYTHGALVIRDDNNAIKAFSDLKGKKSAQTVNSNWANLGTSFGAEIVGTNGFNESIDLVLQGRADATINDDVTFYDYKKNRPASPAKIAALSTDVTANAVLINKKQPELLAAINKALAELSTDGTLRTLSEKYFGFDVSKN